MRKRDLLNANDELFSRNEELLRKIEELKKENLELKRENEELEKQKNELEKQKNELDLKINATKPLKDLEKKVTARASVSKETEYAASVIGKIVVSGAKYCSLLTAMPENSITKEQINLILGRTEVAKAEILKIVGNNMSFEDKKTAIDLKGKEAEEYFNSIMAQSE